MFIGAYATYTLLFFSLLFVYAAKLAIFFLHLMGAMLNFVFSHFIVAMLIVFSENILAWTRLEPEPSYHPLPLQTEHLTTVLN